MSARDRDTDALLDRALARIRAEEPDPESVRAAAQRTREKLRAAAPGAPAAIRGCEDVQRLLPDLHAGRLGEARAMLVRDHLRHCVACRRRLEGRRHEDRPLRAATKPRGRRSSRAWWTVAATVMVVAGLGLLTLVLPGGTGSTALVGEVAGVEAGLFRVTAAGLVPVTPGTAIREGEELRTARTGGAEVRLSDGSLLELDARTAFLVRRGGDDTTIDLLQGGMIIEASDQGSGHLNVNTADALVSVTGTVFSVSSGLVGSRVSVFEGEVEVRGDDAQTTLKPGEQVTTDERLAQIPLAEEIAWSRRLDEHLALLQELKAIGEEIDRRVPRPGRRYASPLLELVPADTAMLLAMPNEGERLAQAHGIFREHLAGSTILRQWWDRALPNEEAEQRLNEMVARVGDVGAALGPEILLAVPWAAEEGLRNPVILAEVEDESSLRNLIEQTAADLAGEDGDGPRLALLDDPLATVDAPADGGLLTWIDEGLVVVTSDRDALVRLARAQQLELVTEFTQRPLYETIRGAYEHGAEWVFALDIERMTSDTLAQAEDTTGAELLGIESIRHLLAELEQTGEHSELDVTLTFHEPRSGIVSWLAEPAPLRTLTFVSPEAKGVSAFAIKDPLQLLDEDLLPFLAREPDALSGWNQAQNELGTDLRSEVAGALGGEIAVAIDGPVLPVPSYKIVLEVYDPVRLQGAIEQLVARWAAEVEPGDEPPRLTRRSGGRGERFLLEIPGIAIDVHYTFVDGYLLAAPSEALLDRTLEQRAAGYTLPSSTEFRQLLPHDRRSNVSALVWQDFGDTLSALTGHVDPSQLTPAQRTAIEALGEDNGPAVAWVWAGPQRIDVAGRWKGGMLTHAIGALWRASVQANGPLAEAHEPPGDPGTAEP
jgi:ferric-dicitrate binding protein FerR (iron transport regulator)